MKTEEGLDLSPEEMWEFADGLKGADDSLKAFLESEEYGEKTLENFTEFLKKQDGGLKGVGKSLKNFGKNMLLNLGVGLATGAIGFLVGKLGSLVETAEEVQQTFDAVRTRIKTLNEDVGGNSAKLGELNSRYQQLSQGVNELGQNVSLTETQYEEYKNIISEVSEIMPDMTTLFNSQGEKIGFAKGQLESLNAEYAKYRQNAALDFLYGDGDDSFGEAIDMYNDQKSKNWFESAGSEFAVF